MAQKKRRTPTKRKERTWTIPRVLLVIGYGAILVFLAVIVMMRLELRRVGFFDTDTPPVVIPPSPVAPPAKTAEVQRPQSFGAKQTPPAPGPEFTADEKRQLDEVLRSRQ
ncbi:MAG: hypothetical protein AB7G75_27075 [Candidatus Binatia bacterium]